MSRHGLRSGVPCGVCAVFIRGWTDGPDPVRALPCRHTNTEIRAVWEAVMSWGDGQPIGTPRQSRPAPTGPDTPVGALFLTGPVGRCHTSGVEVPRARTLGGSGIPLAPRVAVHTTGSGGQRRSHPVPGENPGGGHAQQR